MIEQTLYCTYANIKIDWSVDSFERECSEQSSFHWILKNLHGSTSYEDVTVADPNPRSSQHIGTIELSKPNIFDDSRIVVKNRMIAFLNENPSLDETLINKLQKNNVRLEIDQISNHRIPRMESIYNPAASKNTMVFHGNIYRGNEFERWFTLFGSIRTALI